MFAFFYLLPKGIKIPLCSFVFLCMWYCLFFLSLTLNGHQFNDYYSWYRLKQPYTSSLSTKIPESKNYRSKIFRDKKRIKKVIEADVLCNMDSEDAN